MRSHRSKLLSSTKFLLGVGFAAGSAVALAETAAAATSPTADQANPVAISKSAAEPVRLASCTAAKKGCNPCAAKKGCNPCAAKKGCNPCAAKKGCNPCAAKKNPCKSGSLDVTQPFQVAGSHAKKGCNPCAAKKGCNPCAAKKGCNPCAAKGCNPCAAKKGCNPCAAKKNPCKSGSLDMTKPFQVASCTAAKKGCNPCAAKKACNPCAAKKGCNPCAAKGCNPCAAKKNPCKSGSLDRRGPVVADGTTRSGIRWTAYTA